MVRTKQRYTNSDEFRDKWLVTKLEIGDEPNTAYIDVGATTEDGVERLVKAIKSALKKHR